MSRAIVTYGGTTGSVQPVGVQHDGTGDGRTARCRSRPAPAHEYPPVAFDSKTREDVLFGGHSNIDNLYKQDTWSWSGTDGFRSLPLTNADAKPAGRQWAAMVYDSKRERHDPVRRLPAAATYDDLWTWDATTRVWTQITVTGHAGARCTAHWLFYDAARDKLLLFNNSGYAIWEYDPALNNWKNRTQSPQPTVVNSRSYVEVAFDSARASCVMSAATNGTVDNADAGRVGHHPGTWKVRTPASTVNLPVGRYYHAVTYDSTRKVS